MRTREVRGLLGTLEDRPAPDPSALFVAKLGADLRTMDQAAEAEVRPQRAPRRRGARLLVAAGPVAVLTAAAAAAAVTLLPSDPHPRQVTTADPGVTVPAPPMNETPTSVPTPTTVAPQPWLPPAAAPTPPATTATTAAPRAVAPAPAPASGPTEQPTPTSGPPHEPVTTTAPPETTTTTAPAPQALSLNCQGAMVNSSPAVSCAWTQSTSPSFAWYRLYREAQGSNRVLLFSSNVRTKTSTGDTTAKAGTTYSYVIEATDASGNVVGKSTPVIVSCC